MAVFFWTSRFQLLQGMFVQSLAQILEELNGYDFSILRLMDKNKA